MKNKNIVIKQADKGSAVVIMDRSAYTTEAEHQLKDENFFKPVDKNPIRSASFVLFLLSDTIWGKKV